MSRTKPYPAGLRDRAVRLVLQTADQYPSQDAAIQLRIADGACRGRSLLEVVVGGGSMLQPWLVSGVQIGSTLPKRSRCSSMRSSSPLSTPTTSVYGARKICAALNRRGEQVARCTVERLMRELSLIGATRGGKKIRSTLTDPTANRAPDPLNRAFVATDPNRVWVTDFTHVAAHSGVVYVAFVVDTYSPRIVGWSAATTKHTPLVLAALEMGLWQRDRAGEPRHGLIRHSNAGSQYTGFRLANHLAVEGIASSIGSVGDAYDNAFMESTIGLFKTELINRHSPLAHPDRHRTSHH